MADFLGCPFLTTSGPLELESVMSSCWICSSRRALHTPEQVQWAGTTSLHKHNYASRGLHILWNPQQLVCILSSASAQLWTILHLLNTRLGQLLCVCTIFFLEEGPPASMEFCITTTREALHKHNKHNSGVANFSGCVFSASRNIMSPVLLQNWIKCLQA